MRVLALVKDPGNPSCRYRIEGLRRHFEDAGHALSLEPFAHGLRSRLIQARRLRAADAVIIQRRLLPSWLLRIVRLASRRLVFDFDDAIYRHDSYEARGESGQRLRRFRAAVRAADAVTAGNRFLAERAARFTDSARVHEVPTCIDPGRYTIAGHAGAGDVRLVWIGSLSMVRSLHLAAPLIDRVARSVPGLRLKVICAAFPRFETMRIEEVPWSSAVEAAELSSSDIGLSWLPEDEWSLGKCGLKVIQYMAAGLPVIANPVGMQAEMVHHGRTGYLARTEEEWVDAARRLAGSPDLRRSMGAAGRSLVEAEWSTARAGGAWRILLERLGRSP
jgi:glycosyltransferase involved in cell wall biosynthesis